MSDAAQPLGRVLGRLTVHPERSGDDVIDQDVILLWTPKQRRIITGSDILGRLLRGIARGEAPPPRAKACPSRPAGRVHPEGAPLRSPRARTIAGGSLILRRRCRHVRPAAASGGP